MQTENNRTKIDIPALVDRATEQARAATDDWLANHPGEWFPCGFAWVIITPARGPLVAWLKKQGHKLAYGGGLQVWNPSTNYTQSMNALAAGAHAYAQVLRDAGYQAYADSRMD